MEFIALVIAIIAFIFSRKALKQLQAMEARLALLETAGKGTAAVTSAPVPSAEQPRPLAEAGETETPERPVDIVFEPASGTAFAESASPAQPPSPPAAIPTASAKPGLEERLGTRWVVWVGGLTLALGGLFLVKYSIDQGFVGPLARVILGGLFALVLLGLGEWTRRRERVAPGDALPIANIPAILTAAGTVVAFGDVLAAYALYDLLPPLAAFILMGLVSLGTLLAALLHGPTLAGLGIAAAFVTPRFFAIGNTDFWMLYVYIAFVTATAFGLARLRLWRWLVLTTLIFAFYYALPCLSCGPSMIRPHAFHAMAGFVLTCIFVVAGLLLGPPAQTGRIDTTSSAALSTYLLIGALIVMFGAHADTAMIVFAILVAATLAVAWNADAAVGAVIAAAGLVAIVFLSWAVRGNPDMLVLPGGAMSGVGPRADDASIAIHLTAAVLFGGAFGAAGFLAQGRAPNALIPVVWSACAVFTPLAIMVALYARIAHLDRWIPFAIGAVVLSALFAAAAEMLGKRESRPGQEISIALFATGALSALALAFTFALEKGWLTVALGLMSLAAAWVSLKRPIPFLRWLAAILAGIIMLRNGYDPRIAGEDVGTTPIFNWLLYGYGVPAASFWLGAYFLKKRGVDEPLRMMEAAAILFTVALAFMQIRHAMNRGDVYAERSGLIETALQVSVALAMAIGLERLRLTTLSPVHNIAALILTALAGIGIVFGLFLADLPILTSERVDGIFLNSLLLAYALPALLALALAWTVTGRRPTVYVNAIAAASLALALGYITLQIRQLYHGPLLDDGFITDAEQYSYSAAWLIFGVALLAIGLVFNSQRARLASALVIGITVLKAFVVDMSNLTGVWRALSFMGLGLVLVAIGWLYQRILFRKAPSTRETSSTATDGAVEKVESPPDDNPPEKPGPDGPEPDHPKPQP